MLIAAFAKQAGMSVDTVRFYVRRGLLEPSVGTRGGRNPYQVFSAADVDAAAVIQTCKALGLSLREIAAFLADYKQGRMGDDDLIEFLTEQQSRLKAKMAELDRLTQFLDYKIDWIAGGRVGVMPTVADTPSHPANNKRAC